MPQIRYNEVPEEIGRAIRHRRRLLHLTQQDVAELAGISRQLISRIENGAGSTALDSVVAIARVLGLEIAAVPISSHDG